MGIKRVVDADFWTDDKVMEVFSPEDRYFFLYLLTNPHCNPIGVYKIVPKQIAFEIGYSPDAVSVLLDRFEHTYGMIRFCPYTKEIAIKNYLKYGIVAGGKPILDRMIVDANSVKSLELLDYIYSSASKSNISNRTVKDFLIWLGQFLESKDPETGHSSYGDGNGVGYGYGDGESSHESGHESSHESRRFTPPTVDEVKSYCTEQGYHIDPEGFVDYYSSNGWMVGRGKMKDWKAAVRNWARRDKGKQKEPYDRTRATETEAKSAKEDMERMRRMLEEMKNGN